MKCPFCGSNMQKGRIAVMDRANYKFYPEESYDTTLKKARNKFVRTADGIRLDKPRVTSFLGTEIENCFYCADCKKIVIEMDKDKDKDKDKKTVL